MFINMMKEPQTDALLLSLEAARHKVLFAVLAMNLDSIDFGDKCG
jgi:hypothetical protein